MTTEDSASPTANWRHPTLAVLGLHDQPCPSRKRQTSLIEVVMAIVRSLNTLELVTEASFGNLPPYFERGQMRARTATQVMEDEVRQAVGDT